MLKPFIKLSTIILISLTIILSPAAQANGSILILGDSLSAAYQMNPEQGWVNHISDAIKDCNAHYQVINLSTSGDTTRTGLQKLPTALENSPTVVLIELGGNDGLRGLPLLHIKKNLIKLIEMSLNKKAKVLLAGIKLPPNYGKSYTDSFYQIYTDLSENYDVTFLPFLLEDIALDPKYMLDDGIHPNIKAQPLIAKKVWPVLINMLDSGALNHCSPPGGA